MTARARTKRKRTDKERLDWLMDNLVEIIWREGPCFDTRKALDKAIAFSEAEIRLDERLDAAMKADVKGGR